MRIDLTTRLSSSIAEIAVQLVPLLDLIVKSGFIVLLASLVVFLFRPHLSAFSRHKIWLGALACIVLLPIPSRYGEPPVEHPAANVAYDLVTVSIVTAESAVDLQVVGEPAGDEETTEASGSVDLDWIRILTSAYLLVFLVLVLRIARDAVRAHMISKCSTPIVNLALVKKTNQLKKSLGINRPVFIKFSREISSPLSMGLLNPVVVFPSGAKDWSASAFNSALTHEFSHISRFDWLFSTVGYLFCALMWINPFAWYSLSRMNIEAENASDMEVLRSGVSSNQYAEDLLAIARSSKCANRQKLLAQYMLPSDMLKSRMALLLQPRPHYPESKIFQPVLAVLISGLVVLLSLGNFLRTTVVSQPNWYSDQYTAHFDSWADKAVTYSIMPNSDTAVTVEDGANRFIESWTVPDIEPLAQDIQFPLRDEFRPDGLIVGMQGNESGDSVSSSVSIPKIEFAPDSLFADVIEVLKLPVIASPAFLSSEQKNPENSFEYSEGETLSRSELINEIVRIETEYYRAFNAAETDKSLHIHCGKYLPTGSYIPRRYCEPNFITQARSYEVRDLLAQKKRPQDTVTLVGQQMAQFRRLTKAMNNALNTNQHFRELYERLVVLRNELTDPI